MTQEGWAWNFQTGSIGRVDVDGEGRIAFTANPSYDAILRCEGCGHGRKAKAVKIQNVEYLEQPGASCENCGNRIGGPDERDVLLAKLIRDEQLRESVSAASDRISEMFNSLHDKGVDSYVAGLIARDFALGHLKQDLGRRWQS